MAPMMGLSTWMLRPNCGRKSTGTSVSDVSAISFRSPPALKALSPAPVSTRTLAVSSSTKRRAPSQRPSRTALLNALRASGRLIVNQATSLTTSYVTTSLTGRFLHHKHELPGLDLLADCDAHLVDRPVMRSPDGVLHLHGF